jgi:hypothetical protein
MKWLNVRYPLTFPYPLTLYYAPPQKLFEEPKVETDNFPGAHAEVSFTLLAPIIIDYQGGCCGYWAGL